MKKNILLIIIALLSMQSSFAQRDSTIVESDKITLSLLTHFSIMRSANFGYEKQLSPMSSLETELGYIYASFISTNSTGIIWRNTYKRFTRQMTDGRLFFGPQLVLHYHKVKQEGIYSHLDGLFFEKDDLFREKFRASIMGVLGREWNISKKIFLEFNIGLGAKYDVVKLSFDNEGDYVSMVNPSFLFRRAGARLLPDANFALKLKYNLNT